jgi:hypothetical protein
MRKLRSILLLVLPLLTGCAAPYAGRAGATTPAKLIGCSGYTAPLQAWTRANRFWIRSTVGADGHVIRGSSRRVESEADRGTTEGVAQAKQMAETCTYDPATRDGLAVESEVTLEVGF